MISYRPMREEDIPQVLVIENQCFTSEAWSEENLRREFHENAENAHYTVAVEALEPHTERIVGYGGYWQSFDEAYITNIAVLPTERRRGIATGLFQAIEAEFPSRGILYETLEVRLSNTPARALYRKQGFTEAGIRKNYYERPREDAMIMWKKPE